MWIMTKIGFYSIVEKQNQICVRTRVRKDLRNFKSLISGCGPIIHTKLSDYKYRVFIPKDVFEAEFYKLAKLVTYGNFKGEIMKKNVTREKLYMRVWQLLFELEHEEAELTPVYSEPNWKSLLQEQNDSLQRQIEQEAENELQAKDLRSA
jgi:hypothetical protein